LTLFIHLARFFEKSLDSFFAPEQKKNGSQNNQSVNHLGRN